MPIDYNYVTNFRRRTLACRIPPAARNYAIPTGVIEQTAAFTIPAKVPVYLANHWVIDVGGRRWDALKLAGQAVADWDDWLTDHQVPLPT